MLNQWVLEDTAPQTGNDGQPLITSTMYLIAVHVLYSHSLGGGYLPIVGRLQQWEHSREINTNKMIDTCPNTQIPLNTCFVLLQFPSSLNPSRWTLTEKCWLFWAVHQQITRLKDWNQKREERLVHRSALGRLCQSNHFVSVGICCITSPLDVLLFT